MVAPIGQAVDILPNLQVGEEEMHTQVLDDEEIPGRILFRFETSLENAGPGEFRIETTGVPVKGADLFQVEQVIQQEGGGSRRVPTPGFSWNPSINMMEVKGWVDYRIRELLPGDAVGNVLKRGAKEQVNITSTRVFDGTIPGAPPGPFRLTAGGGVQGISVGYTDIYPTFLELQWIDITGLPSGEYWLEVAVDPANHALEADENNNETRIKVTFVLPDEDGDGLLDDKEGELGTDPALKDTDEDDFWDRIEVEFGSDPLVKTDTPSTGIPGDVYPDEAVNIIDVQAIINVILFGGMGMPTDVDGDVDTDIMDLNDVVNIILFGS
jgi:hypothetical protein